MNKLLFLFLIAGIGGFAYRHHHNQDWLTGAPLGGGAQDTVENGTPPEAGRSVSGVVGSTGDTVDSARALTNRANDKILKESSTVFEFQAQFYNDQYKAIGNSEEKAEMLFTRLEGCAEKLAPAQTTSSIRSQYAFCLGLAKKIASRFSKLGERYQTMSSAAAGETLALVD